MIKAIDFKEIKNNSGLMKTKKEGTESDFTSIINSITNSEKDSGKSKNNEISKEAKENPYNSLRNNIVESDKKVEDKVPKNFKSQNTNKDSTTKDVDKNEKNSKLDNKEESINNCEEVIEEVIEEVNGESNEEVKESLEELVSLLVQITVNDVGTEDYKNISFEEILSCDSNLVDFVNKSLQDIVSILNNTTVETTNLSPEVLTESLNVISELLQQKGLEGNEVANLLTNLKEMVQVSNINDEEFKTVFSEIVEEVTTLLKTNIEKATEGNKVITQPMNTVDTTNFEKVTNEHQKVEATEESSDDNTNEGTSEDNSSESSSTLNKEEKLLNSILKNNSDNTIVNRFAVFTNDYSIASNVKNIVSAEVNAGTAAYDVVKAIKFMTSEGIDELMVKVNPRGLGALVISIIKEGDVMRAEIKASSKETYNLIMQNSDDIKKYLGEQNIKVHNVDISLTKDATDDSTFFGESHSHNNNKESNNRNIDNGNGVVIEEDEYDLPEELINNINMLV